MERRMTFEEFKYLMMTGIDDEISTSTKGAMLALSGKWKLQILFTIFCTGNGRFNKLKKSLDGITARQLISELRQLEEAGFIEKQAAQDGSDAKEYTLRDKANDLIYLFYDYMNWSFSYPSK